MHVNLSHAVLSELLRRFYGLVLCHTEFGVSRLPYEVRRACGPEDAAWVDAKHHLLRQAPFQCALAVIDKLEGVEVDQGARLCSGGEVGVARVIGAQHDVVARDAAGFGERKLHLVCAVAAAAHLCQQADDRGVGQGLHGEILFEALVPVEGLLQRLRPRAHACLVVEVKRGGEAVGELEELLWRDEWSLRAHSRLVHLRRAISHANPPLPKRNADRSATPTGDETFGNGDSAPAGLPADSSVGIPRRPVGSSVPRATNSADLPPARSEPAGSLALLASAPLSCLEV